MTIIKSEQTIVPPDAKGIDIRNYGAIPNDGKDDTAAIQKALDDGRRDANGNPLHEDFYGRTKFLYFPKGTYDVSNTIDWIGSAVTLNGDGSGKTVFKLKDNAKGFNNSNAPKAIFKAPNGNTSFRQNIWNLSVDTGKGNAGAIGVDYNSSNQGSMENVTITSGDGKGYTGLAMYDGLPGPLLVKNVKINGFDTGIGVSSGEYGVILKNIELTNQNKTGISAGGGMVTVHGLKSKNSVPVIEGNDWSGMVTLVDGDFQGGSSDVSAIATQGQLYVRNVNARGYESAIKYKDEIIGSNTVEEYTSKTSQLFDNSAKKSLNLPIKDIPEFNDSNLDNWGRFEAKEYGDTSRLQDLLNSGKSTIYFPADIYFSYNQKVVEVPPTVKKIVGFSSTVNGSKDGKDGGGIKFVVKGDSKDPLIVEGFGYGITVENQAARDVALKNGKYAYIDAPGVGDLYLENIQIKELDLKDTKNVYAWQLNTESQGKARLKVKNSGANMVVFGIKTEGKGTIIETINGGKTEVLGGFILPVSKFSNKEKKDPAFRSVDSETSLSLRFRDYENPDTMYDVLVEETRDGETRQLKSSGSPHQYLSLYSGNQTTKSQLGEDSSNPKPQSPREPIKNKSLRYEAEELTLNGYQTETVKGSGASGGKHISLKNTGQNKGFAEGTFTGETGKYQVKVGYYDENDGQSRATVTVKEETTSFVFDQDLPNNWTKPASKTSRVAIEEVQLKSGDTFKIEASSNKGEYARFDYIEFIPIEEINYIQTNSESEPIPASVSKNPKNSNVENIVVDGIVDLRNIDLDGNGKTDKKVSLTVDDIKNNPSYSNSGGFYQVLDLDGTVVDPLTDQFIQPGEQGYETAALSQRIPALEFHVDNSSSTAEVNGGIILAPYLISNGSAGEFIDKNPNNDKHTNSLNAYFAFGNANPKGIQHLKYSDKNFSFENSYGGGNKDFNDVTFNLNVESP